MEGPIPFKLKVRSYISSMYFSWKYGLRMGQRGFWKMSFQNPRCPNIGLTPYIHPKSCL
jgi:hypothetical protein